jgi:hypothetical protein
MSTDLILKHGGRLANDYDVVHDGKLVGRIFLPGAGAPRESPWVWSIYFEHREPGRAFKGNGVDREDAMKQFADAWRGE